MFRSEAIRSARPRWVGPRLQGLARHPIAAPRRLRRSLQAVPSGYARGKCGRIWRTLGVVARIFSGNLYTPRIIEEYHRAVVKKRVDLPAVEPN